MRAAGGAFAMSLLAAAAAVLAVPAREAGKGEAGGYRLVADNGSGWSVTGAPSRGWDNDDLHSLERVRGSDFEVVDSRRLPRPRR